jgi:3-deoxy-D-manno-octulosonic-acid transferase
LNSKIAEKDCRFWRYFPGFFGGILAKFQFNIPQSKIDLQRFSEFYSANLHFIGNIKYAAQLSSLNEELIAKISKEVKGKKIITIASTHKGEEELLISCLSDLLKREDIFIFLAPRHIDRKKEVEEILRRHKVDYINRTSNDNIKDQTKLMLVDTLGELNNFYYMSDISIVCGSFNYVVGGHNIIEPARYNNAIIVGPNMKSFEEILQDFLKNNAIIQVKNPSFLNEEINKLLDEEIFFTELQKNAFNLTEFYYNIYPEIKNFIDRQL